jgi:hypothetical protein
VFGRRKFVRLRRITFLISLLVLAAAPAHALDVGRCDTPEGLSAKLRTEGHKIVATMDMYGYDVDAKEWGHVAVLITATPDLKHWYTLKGDQPLGTKSTRMCIADRGKALEISDYRRDGPATVTRYRFVREKALASCEKVLRNYMPGARCNEHYVVVEGFRKEFGERIAMQGEAEGGILMTIVANPNSNKDKFLSDRDYRMLVTTSDGAAGIALRGERFAFSEWVLSVLDRRRTAVKDTGLTQGHPAQ